MVLGPQGPCNAGGGAWRRRSARLLDRCQAVLSPPPPKPPGGLQEGIGAGSGGIAEAAGFGAERRFGAALRADFFLVDLFAAAFILRFLRAGAAFRFFLVERFFALVLFAMMDLPILVKFKLVLPRAPGISTAPDTSQPILGRGSLLLLGSPAQPVAVAGYIARFVAALGRCSRNADG